MNKSESNSNLCTMDQKLYLQLFSKVCTQMDAAVKPLLSNYETNMMAKLKASKKIPAKSQTDLNFVIDLSLGDRESTVANYMDFLIASCPVESRSFLLTLRANIENLVTRAQALAEKYEEVLPVLNTIVPETVKQNDLVKDVKVCNYHLDAVTDSNMAEWFVHKRIFDKSLIEAYRDHAVKVNHNGSKNKDKKSKTPKSPVPAPKTKVKCLNFDAASKPGVKTKVAADKPVDKSVGKVSKKKNSPDGKNGEHSSDKVANVPVEAVQADVQEKDEHSDTDNYVVKECSVEGCDFSVETESGISFGKHFLLHHPKVTGPKWTIKDIDSATYNARRNKWFPKE